MTAFLFFASLLGWTMALAFGAMLWACKKTRDDQSLLIQELSDYNEELSTQCEALIDRVNDLERDGEEWKRQP